MLGKALGALRERYREGVSAVRPALEGRRVAIYSMHNRDVEWQVRTLKDVGAEIVFIMFGMDSFDDHEAKSPSYGDTPVMEGGLCELGKVAEAGRLDVLVTNFPRASRLGVPYSRLGSPRFGVEGAIEWLRILADSMRLPAGRGWRDGL
jgi:nitrogenase molybdenum-iron protein alpha/beta subunit